MNSCNTSKAKHGLLSLFQSFYLEEKKITEKITTNCHYLKDNYTLSIYCNSVNCLLERPASRCDILDSFGLVFCNIIKYCVQVLSISKPIYVINCERAIEDTRSFESLHSFYQDFFRVFKLFFVSTNIPKLSSKWRSRTKI